MKSDVNICFCNVKISSFPVYSDDIQLCTAKFYNKERVSLGIRYEADIFEEMIEFRPNLIFDQ